MVKRFIITGGPCSGKTSLIQQLALQGYPTFQEAARLIIQQEMAKNSSAVPWLDNAAFSELVIEQQKEDHLNALPRINFYDRGIPDVLGYLKHYKQQHIAPKFVKIAQELNYHSFVFILPPWEKIYELDSERKETFEEAVQVYEALVESYQNLNYNLIEVPCASTQERLNFIVSQIEQL